MCSYDIMLQKVKKVNIGDLESRGIIAIARWSPTPAGILVDILIPASTIKYT